MSFLEVCGSNAQLEEIRDKLRSIVGSLHSDAGPGAGSASEKRTFRLTLAYYPLPRRKDEARSPRKR